MGNSQQLRLKSTYLALEGLNALGVGLYYTYLFWFMQARFGFGDRENLAVAALNGLIYTGCAWQGGRLAQRIGYLPTLLLGSVVMTVCLAVAVGFDVLPATRDSSAWQVLALVLWTLGVSVTWPSLEAMVTDGVKTTDLPRMVGRYNVTWATGWAIAYFAGGGMLETLGPRSVFVVPLLIHIIQILWMIRVRRRPDAGVSLEPATPADVDSAGPITAPHAKAAMFRRLGWIANPFAYLAITALVPVIPTLAGRHGLQPAWAGVFCSTWFFARLAAFFLLWRWPAWHYRFRWLVAAKLLLIVSFAGILFSPSLWPIFFFQVIFGLAVGLIYYSSLYYSMDAGEEKGEHGGIHEAAIGAGIFAGPAIGYAALVALPGWQQADTWAVCAVLVLGLLWLVRVRVAG